MKKIGIATLIMGAMLLTACNDANIGIIGGADGPTSIFIGEEIENNTSLKLKIVDGSYTGELILAGTNKYDVYTLNVKETPVFIDGKEANYTDLEDGMPVTVDFDGSIEETFPAKLGSVKGIYGHSIGTQQNPGGTFYDLSGLYLKVLNDLWETDSGLNSDIKYISVDLSKAPAGLTEGEKSAVCWIFANSHNAEGLQLSLDELDAEGYMDKDKLYWEDGILFSITDKMGENEIHFGLNTIKFDAKKWRSGDGAYFFNDCTASCSQMGTWETYNVGGHAIS